ncbi:MAG: hypothetical protein ACK5WY_05335 [Holosporaceae bacterium]
MDHNDITLADVIMAQAVTVQIETFWENYENLEGSPVERLRQFLTESLEAPDELLDLARLTLADLSDKRAQHGLNLERLEALFMVVLTAADPDANVEALRNLFLEFIGETLPELGSTRDPRGNFGR